VTRIIEDRMAIPVFSALANGMVTVEMDVKVHLGDETATCGFCGRNQGSIVVVEATAYDAMFVHRLAELDIKQIFRSGFAVCGDCYDQWQATVHHGLCHNHGEWVEGTITH
jgi:transcription elongation factor Elf1